MSNEFQEKISSLTENELKVLGILHMLGDGYYGYGDCYLGHNSILSGEGNIPSIDKEIGGRRGLSKALKKLRDLDLVQFAHGLMNNDGEVCGSGNAPNKRWQDDIETLCEKKSWL